MDLYTFACLELLWLIGDEHKESCWKDVMALCYSGRPDYGGIPPVCAPANGLPTRGIQILN